MTDADLINAAYLLVGAAITAASFAVYTIWRDQ